MRILMVTATYYPSANGVAVSVENLKNSLKKAGQEVKVLAPDSKKAKKDPDVLRYPSLKNPIINDYPIPIFPGLKSLYKIITTFKPDIIHAHHPFQVGFFAGLLADRFKVPLVFTYHTRYDLYAEKYANFLPKKFKLKFIEKNVDDFCSKTDLIISPSNFLKKILQKRYINKKIAVIPSALPEFQTTELTKAEIRKRLKLDMNKKILLSVSRLGKEKNTDLLLKAIRYLPETCYLCLVGTGPEENNLKKLADRLKIKKRVFFTGKIPHNKIHLYYRAADLFVFASKTETQGLIFLEALNFGLPVVAVESEASIEWINKYSGKIVNNDPKSIAKTIMLLDRESIKFNKSKMKKIAGNYSQEKITEKMIKEYKLLLNK